MSESAKDFTMTYDDIKAHVQTQDAIIRNLRAEVERLREERGALVDALEACESARREGASLRDVEACARQALESLDDR